MGLQASGLLEQYLGLATLEGQLYPSGALFVASLLPRAARWVVEDEAGLRGQREATVDDLT